MESEPSLTKAANREQHVLAGIRGIAVTVYLLLAVIVVATAPSRMAYSYQRNWMEGCIFSQAVRVCEGQTLYSDPTKGWADFIYTPGYQNLCGWLFKLTGPSLAVMRVVSLVATLVTALMCGLIGRRFTGTRWAVLFGAAAYLAGYNLSGTTMDTIRTDSLALMWLAVLFFLLTSQRYSPGLMLLSAVVSAAAVFCKQTSAAVIFPWVTLALILYDWRRGVLYLVSTAVIIGAVVLFLQWQTDGWFLFYVWQVPASHPVILKRLLVSAPYDLTAAFSLPILVAVFLAVAGDKLGLVSGSRRWMLLAFLGGCCFSYVLSRSKVGGYTNNLIVPTLAGAAVLATAVGAELKIRIGSTRLRIAFYLCLLLYVHTLVCNRSGIWPRQWLMPSVYFAEGKQQIVDELKALPKPVYFPSNPHYARLIGEPMLPGGVMSEETAGLPRGGFPESVMDRIRRKQFAAIVTHKPVKKGAAANLRDRLIQDHYRLERVIAPKTFPTGQPADFPAYVYLPQ